MLVALAVPATAEPPPGAGAEPPPRVIVNATLVDGTGAAPIPDAVIRMEGGRIRCAGPRASCPPPPDAETLDAGGRVALPGLIDTHVHVEGATDPALAEQRQRLRLAYGLTTVREASSEGQTAANLAARGDAERADRPVPRLHVAGGVHHKNLAAFGDPDYAALARRMIDWPADSLKIKGPLDDAALAAIFAVAREAGVAVWGHTWSGPEPLRSYLRVAVDEGLAGVSHLKSLAQVAQPEGGRVLEPPVRYGRQPADYARWRMSLWSSASPERLDAWSDRLIERDVWLEPTLVMEHSLVDRADFVAPAGYPESLAFLADWDLHVPTFDWREAERAELEAALAAMRRFVGRFHARGGRVLAGSDWDALPGLALHRELALLVASGLSPADALAAATREAARVLGRPDLGTLEPGRRADLVLVDGDPLRRIEDTRRIWRVVKGGVIYEPEALFEALREPVRSRARARQRATRRRVVVAIAATLALAAAAATYLIRRRGASTGDAARGGA